MLPTIWLKLAMALGLRRAKRRPMVETPSRTAI